MTHLNVTRLSLAITVVFNTIIALVLYFMVLNKESFWEIFIISQLTGLSICESVNISRMISEKKYKNWKGTWTAIGLMTGVVAGSMLSWGYLALFHGLSLGYYYKHVFSYVAVFGVVFGVPIIYFFSAREKLAESEKRIQNEKIKRLTMEKEAAMTTLQLLQAQIEPHFLFNTLANVISLFDIDMDKAKQMLIDVNEYLRISLARTRQEMITLSQELDLIRQYLEIFKVRMGKRLTYEITDRTGRPDFRFPPLIVQPLVENAIKYGLEPKIDGGKIVIDCSVRHDMLVIEIADTGQGMDGDINRAGIGINNVSRRLESVYGSRASLTLTENPDKGVKAVIRVPA